MAAAWVLAALVAGAAPARADDGWQFSVEAQTDLMSLVGGTLALESPGRIILAQTLGWWPTGYLATSMNAAVGLGILDRPDADLIEAVVDDSLVWRSQMGWRPFAGRGFYVLGGWTLLTLGGTSTPARVLEALTGVAVPAEIDAANLPFEIKNRIAMLDAELGWRWVWWEHLTVRAGLGGSFALTSSTRIEPQFTPSAPGAVTAFGNQVEQAADERIEDSLYLPMARLAIGYVF